MGIELNPSAIYKTVNGAVHWVVKGAVDRAVDWTVRDGHPHLNLHLFVAEIQQIRGGVL